MNAASPTRLLGFDYGTRRIGVAVGQTLTATATPLGTARCENGSPDWERIDAWLREWRPSALVLGLPHHADGTDNALTPRVREFGNALETRTGLTIHMVDERLSSHAAEQSLRTSGRRPEPEEIDALAAARILQDWLEDRPPVRTETAGES